MESRVRPLARSLTDRFPRHIKWSTCSQAKGVQARSIENQNVLAPTLYKRMLATYGPRVRKNNVEVGIVRNHNNHY